MKAEHRHELKTNELAVWLSNLPAWANENSRTILVIAIIAIIAIGGYFYYRYQKVVVASREKENLTALISQMQQQKAIIAQTQIKGEDNSYTLFNITDALETTARGSGNDALAALATIKEAEVIRTELHFRFGTPSEQDILTQTGKAKDLYNKALDTYLKRSPDATLEGIAKIGIGLCNEEIGDANEARKLYQEVAAGAQYEGTVAAAAAKERITSLETFTQKVTFKPMPKPMIQIQQPANPEPNLPGMN